MNTQKETAPEGAAVTAPDASPSVDNIVGLHDNPVKYDVAALRQFINTVFHSQHGEIYTQLSKRAPRGFGDTAERVIRDRLARTEAPMRGYFSTASLDLTDGQMRHSKSAFKAFHLMVLDDVGTKIPWSVIPEALIENYRIESSPGNFQLGFILAEPITDYEEAQALIDLFVDAKLTDKGGAMPCKKVRLPCGVNGKKGPNQFFQVKMGELDSQPWGIQELLDAAGIDVDWDVYRKEAKTKARRTQRLKTSAWNPDLHYVDPHTGVYDPLLEWLYDQNMVIEDSQEPFFHIICPFHETHTDKDLESSLAGYSPLGHGLYPHRRVFYCFHGHHSEHTAEDYIMRLYGQGAPAVPVTEYAPEDVVKYVYDAHNDRVFDITKPRSPAYKVESINRITPRIRIPKPSGSWVEAEQLSLWLKQPSACVVDGTVSDPSSTDKIIEDNGQRLFNLGDRPEYPEIPVDMSHVDRFTDFIDYLVPDPDERQYFINWLAAKVQNPAFRGAGIVLISETQGVGKNVMFTLLQQMWGVYNAQLVSMDTLLHPQNFNEHVGALFNCVSETMAVDDPKQVYRAYNRLKELVDPSAQHVMVNQKYGIKYLSRTCTSYLFFSNHRDAVALQQGDRRFYAMSGPHVTRSPQYFTDLCAWRDAGEWRVHVWNWLKTLEVDADMYAKAPQSKTGDEMAVQSKSLLEHVVGQAVAAWPSELVPWRPIKELLSRYVPDGLPPDAAVRNRIGERVFRSCTRSLRATDDQFSSRIAKMRHSLRDPKLMGQWDALKLEKGRALAALADYKEDEFKQAVDQRLDDLGVEIL